MLHDQNRKINNVLGQSMISSSAWHGILNRDVDVSSSIWCVHVDYNYDLWCFHVDYNMIYDVDLVFLCGL